MARTCAPLACARSLAVRETRVLSPCNNQRPGLPQPRPRLDETLEVLVGLVGSHAQGEALRQLVTRAKSGCLARGARTVLRGNAERHGRDLASGDAQTDQVVGSSLGDRQDVPGGPGSRQVREPVDPTEGRRMCARDRQRDDVVHRDHRWARQEVRHQVIRRMV